MLRKKLLIALGVIIALSPYIGIPHSWLMVLLPVMGIAIAAIALTVAVPVVRTVSHETQAASI